MMKNGFEGYYSANLQSFDDLPKSVIKACHKCYISKTIGIAVVAIALENSLENRGTAMKLCFQRAESFKVAKRIAKNKNGNVLRKMGNLFKVDCAMTGSSYGTDNDLKFPLKPFFEKKVFHVFQI